MNENVVDEFLLSNKSFNECVYRSLQTALKVEIPKTFVSGTGHFQRDVTYSTQTFQVIIKNLSRTIEFTLSSHYRLHWLPIASSIVYLYLS